MQTCAKKYDPQHLQPHTRIILPSSISRSFLHVLGEELASDKVDQLGLRAEHGDGGSCKAQRPDADVNQPCRPTLVAAEECLKQRKQAIEGKPGSTR